MDKKRKEQLNQFCKKVKIRFKDLELLDLAFHHRSITNEKKHVHNNERLEFLGDSVLGIVTAAYLYKNFDKPEGDLAKIKSAVVSEKALAPIAVEFGIDKLLILTGDDILYLLDILNGEGIAGRGDRAVAVLFLVEHGQLMLLVGHEDDLVIDG